MLSRPANQNPQPLIRVLHYIWALPNTLLGIFAAFIGILTGGKCYLKRGCIECHGGLLTWLLKRTSKPAGVMAMTLGHAIVGQSQAALNVARDHEHVHVRQYERWGPFFLPAYLGCSLFLYLQKKECYRGNPFEIEAYRYSDPTHRSTII